MKSTAPEYRRKPAILDRRAKRMREYNLTHGTGCWMRALPVAERHQRAKYAADARWDAAKARLAARGAAL